MLAPFNVLMTFIYLVSFLSVWRTCSIRKIVVSGPSWLDLPLSFHLSIMLMLVVGWLTLRMDSVTPSVGLLCGRYGANLFDMLLPL